MPFWFSAAKLAWKVLRAVTRRDLTPGMSGDDFAIFYADDKPTLNFTGVEVDLSANISNTTALFKFANGKEELGNVTNFSNVLPKGIGHGNFSVGNDSGQWITVDLSSGTPEAADLFKWLVTATQDGNVTAEEFKAATDLIILDAKAA